MHLMSGRSSRPVAMAAVLAGAVLSACGQGETARPAQPAAAAPTAESVAAQSGDLPRGLQRCDFSGSMASYLENVEKLSSDTYQSVKATWAQFQGAGATDAQVAIYADTPRACTYSVTGAPPGHEHGMVRVVSSIVVQFNDPTAAEAGYRADIFEQSKLSGGPGVATGPETGLGPNAVFADATTSKPSSVQAVWQKGAFNIFFTSQNLTIAESRAAASAEDQRTR